MPVSREQRFYPDRPCPVCKGHDKMERGQGTRCHGYLSTNGEYANCTNTDFAGTLEINQRDSTYGHRLKGDCRCGVRHDPTEDDRPRSRAPRGTLEAAYDYTDEDGNLLFQAVRFQNPKSFRQRIPDTTEPDGWDWKLGKTRRVLYKLRDLVSADPTATVYIVEGEKDVHRLQSIGAVATTNPMGAGKWGSGDYNKSFDGRTVVVIPDLDPPNVEKPAESYVGQKHALMVAESLHRYGITVRVLELPDLPPKGDVSDWLDAGGDFDQLEQLARNVKIYGPDNPYHPGGVPTDAGTIPMESPADGAFWASRESKHRDTSQRFINQGLKQNGRFLLADNEPYYFNNATKTVCLLKSRDMTQLLNREYKINSTEAFSNYLLADMEAETYQEGETVKVSNFSHYDPETNLMFLDLGRGRMLKLDGQRIEEVDNGTHGVLFTTSQYSDPWDFQPDWKHQGENGGTLLGESLIRSINFGAGEHTAYSVEDQQLLLLLWLVSIAFQSIQPTKPVAVTLGERGSGKTSVFRRIGRLLYGPAFEVEGITREGEADFYVSITHSPFCAFDNVDQRIPWLEDAIARVATGMKITKKILYTTNDQATYRPACFLAFTARTPRFRRDDVASRILTFRLEPIENAIPENVLLRQVDQDRNKMMSEYAVILNRVVATTDYEVTNTDLRLADFANIATRIGVALDQDEAVRRVLSGLNASQHIFATEESELYAVLDLWIRQFNTFNDGRMIQDPIPNDGRIISTEELFKELDAVAESNGFKWTVRNPQALGVQLNHLKEALGVYFDIDRPRTKAKKGWAFTLKPEYETEHAEVL